MRIAAGDIELNQGDNVGQRWQRKHSIKQLIDLLDEEGLEYPQKAIVYGQLADWYAEEQD